MRASVKQKLFAMISALILLSILSVTVLTYRNYEENLVRQSTESTRQLLEQLGINVDTYLDELFRLCLSPYYDRLVMEQLEIAPATAAGRLEKQRIIEDYLAEVMTLPRSDILRAYILSDQVYSSSKTRYGADIPSDFSQEPWYLEAMASSKAVFMPVRLERQGTTELSVFSFAQRINSMSDSQTVVGVIRIDANFNGIKAVCDRAVTGSGNALFVLDGSGNQIYRDNQTGGDLLPVLMDALHENSEISTFSMVVDREEYVVNVQPLQVTDWYILDVHSRQALTAAAVQARNKAVLLAFICAALGVLISIPSVRLFLKPIFRITSLMKKVENGDLQVQAQVHRNDEFAYLARSFNEMIVQIRGEIERNNLLTRQIYEARYLEKEAQYVALCNQIRPHFLFNALNTIHLLTKMGKNEEAVQCIDMLVTLLRGMVDTDRDITLKAEMNIVESYLCLQQKRHQNLTYSLPDISALDTVLLPELTIQPIVENALVHGCEPKRGKTHIDISITSNEENLNITVSDNGIGMSREKLQSLLDAIARPAEAPGQENGGVGLVNISRRIQLKYGEQYGLEISHNEGNGLRVTLRLPLRGENHA